MSKCYIQLGRTGDILNILPMLWADAQAGKASSLIVSKEYSTVLEGVSYCTPIVFDGPAHDVLGAVELAESKGLDWVCTQVNCPVEYAKQFVYGPAKLERAMTTSFQKEQWRVAGRLAEFGQYPLIFDQRSFNREQALAKAAITKKGKYIAVAPDGISSPFRYRHLLLELVRHCGYSVIDLSTVQAERFYDLLVILENAVALVSIDTAHLHLAYAVPKLPVFALVNDQPLFWNGSSWRGQHEFYCRYGDFVDRAVEMVEGLRGLRASRRIPTVAVHLWNALLWDSSKNGKTNEVKLEGWKGMPILKGMCARLGPPDKPEHPYLRDCIRMALQRASGKTLLCITGPLVQFTCRNEAIYVDNAPCYAYRLVRRDGALECSPVADLFCAPGDWWREHLTEIPDLLFSNDYYWRHCLWALFYKYGGKDITTTIEVQASPSKAGTPISPPAAFNSPIAAAYIRDQRITSRYPKVTEQLPCAKFEPGGLKPFAYNPTILQHEDMLMMAYRYHPDPAISSTRIVLSQIDLDGAVLSNRELDLNCKSAEDPKLFPGPVRFPYISYVASSLPSLPARAVVRCSELVNGKPWELVTPAIGKNDETAIEKNWVLWWYRGQMAIVYRCHPTHQVFLGGKDGWKLHETPGPRWPWGPIKGGTPPIEFDGKLLRFFHSTTEQEFGPHPRRYYVGAMLMQSDPPFEVLRVSSKPVLYGSEIDDVRVKDRPLHWKPNVVFPGGALARGAGWVLAVGVNDCQCVLSTVEVKDLHL